MWQIVPESLSEGRDVPCMGESPGFADSLRWPQLIGGVVRTEQHYRDGDPTRALTRGQRVLMEEGKEFRNWEDLRFL